MVKAGILVLVDIKLGFIHHQREITISTESSFDDIERSWLDALASKSTFTIESSQGRRLVLLAESVAYLDVASEAGRQVGFTF